MPSLRFLTAVFTASCICILTGCSLPPQHPRLHRASSRSAMPVIDLSRLEKRIHRLINKERTSRGLSPLALDAALVRIARGHSADMARRDYFAHDSPEGHDFSYRYRSAGYACGVTVGSTVYLGAENIALTNRAASVITVNGIASYDWNSEETIARTTVQGWMNSTGHRKNILTPYWNKEGIGVQIAPDGRIYITQNFC